MNHGFECLCESCMREKELILERQQRILQQTQVTKEPGTKSHWRGKVASNKVSRTRRRRGCCGKSRKK